MIIAIAVPISWPTTMRPTVACLPRSLTPSMASREVGRVHLDDDLALVEQVEPLEGRGLQGRACDGRAPCRSGPRSLETCFATRSGSSDSESGGLRLLHRLGAHVHRRATGSARSPRPGSTALIASVRLLSRRRPLLNTAPMNPDSAPPMERHAAVHEVLAREPVHVAAELLLVEVGGGRAEREEPVGDARDVGRPQRVDQPEQVHPLGGLELADEAQVEEDHPLGRRAPRSGCRGAGRRGRSRRSAPA